MGRSSTERPISRTWRASVASPATPDRAVVVGAAPVVGGTLVVDVDVHVVVVAGGDGSGVDGATAVGRTVDGDDPVAGDASAVGREPAGVDDAIAEDAVADDEAVAGSATVDGSVEWASSAHAAMRTVSATTPAITRCRPLGRIRSTVPPRPSQPAGSDRLTDVAGMGGGFAHDLADLGQRQDE